MLSALIDPLELAAWPTQNFCVGQIVALTDEGRALVDWPDNPGEPLEARSVITVPPQGVGAGYEGASVLLVFENGNATLPIIVGVIRDTLVPPPPPEQAARVLGRPREVVLDNKRLVLEAKEEIMLRCGKGSITLRKDGKIVVKGAEIVSRASGVQKIKGAAVKIN